MKTMTKTLLVSALTLACAGGVYAQAGGGSAGSGGGGGTDSGAVGGPGAQPGGTLNQPSSRSRDTGGYGTPGTTGTGTGKSTMQPGDTPASGTRGYGTTPQTDPSYQRRQ